MQGLIPLIIFIVIVGFVLALCVFLIRKAPIDGTLKTWAEWLAYVAAFLLILQRALPLAGIDI